MTLTSELRASVELEQAIQSARLAAQGKLGVVRLGFVSTAGTYLIPKLINQFRVLNPLVEFSLRNVLTADQGQMLEEGAIDLGFLRMPFATGPNLEVASIHQENLLIVVPSSHALARKCAIRLRESANETYVLYERAPAPGFHDFVLGILNRAGVIPAVSQVAGEMPTLISLVASGGGISLLPASAVENSRAAVTGCRVRDKISISEIALGWRKKPATEVVEQRRGESNPCFDDVRLRASADVLPERTRERSDRRGLFRTAPDVITFVITSHHIAKRATCLPGRQTKRRPPSSRGR